MLSLVQQKRSTKEHCTKYIAITFRKIKRISTHLIRDRRGKESYRLGLSHIRKYHMKSTNALAPHLLLCSPTGSGKTLTAFLTIIDQLVRKALDGKLEKRIHCVYISPIKALANDIQKNLIGPLTEISERFLPDRAQEIKVGLRTGDTPQSERQKMLRNPPHILITTPESLAIAITSPRFQPIISDVEYMIIDELHSLVPTKRGVHLALTLAYLDTSATYWNFCYNGAFGDCCRISCRK